ncbi:hypothetical protein EQM14_07595 [Caproiciproducens sp. NJN-50]|uniref:hypothetical protein n=1 Tax=Acutalibacteraceae TaxID=3082771 RepID=UPI000FFE14A6|nr:MULTISPECIES: hypothetical protein [Acutalibacteraceae]QAT49647.1 hypothetical protein EQM14_07595 [Caproiciproducens sp. NJN-50]
MFEILFKTLFVLFAILGIVEAFRMFLFWLLKTENPGKLYLVISISGHDENAELVLRSACERIRWIPDGNTELIVIDRGMDEETRQICEMACLDFPEVHICRANEVSKIIQV